MNASRRLGIVLALGVGALIVMGTPALAQDINTGDQLPSFVVFTGHLEIPEGTTYDAAVIFDGPLSVAGTVTGDAVAFNGDVTISGTVQGNVVATNGRVTVQQGAQVLGDVMSSKTPVIAPGTVRGSVKRGVDFNLGTSVVVGRFVWWLLVTGSVFVLGLMLTLILPRAADSLAETALRKAGASAGWGAAMALGLPVVAGIALFTIVATLAAGGLFLALALIYTFAYTVGALALGRALVKAPRHRFLAFLAGFAILRIIALIPFLAGLCFLIVAGWGLGAITVASFRAGRASGAPASSAGAGGGAPMPPMPTMP
jgi:hypothetical protein